MYTERQHIRQKTRGHKLTLILPGQCISLFPQSTCREDTSRDADRERGETWDVIGDGD